jgi:DNA polymerase-3 subunit gamma/tau
MAYQALYRAYRPKTFADMVGQDVITKTLQNAIASGQTAHAYLFAGPRGTGKTSAAKIFAREINGLDAQTPDDQAPDIIEIDAASNNGVDEIRNIRDGANYAPIAAPFKIYIIDEVHMLSTGAFNALLKTLEEPPANVKFLLATTDPQKIPATVLSRVQRFDFKRIDQTTIQARLQVVLDDQKIAYEQDALRIIANAAEGGMRDALSILDQVIAYGADQVTVDNALQVTGSVTMQQLWQYLQAVAQQQTQEALQLLQTILLDGKDAQRFVADVMSLIRDVMLAQAAPDLVKSALPLADLQALQAQINLSRLQDMMLTLDEVAKQLLQTRQSDVYLELLTVRLSVVGGALTTTQPVTPAPQESRNVQPAQPVVPASEQPIQPAQPQDQPKDTPVAPKKQPVADSQVLSQDELDEASQETVSNNDANDNVAPEVSLPEASHSSDDAAQEPAMTPPAAANQFVNESTVVMQPVARQGERAVRAVLMQANRDAVANMKQQWATVLQELTVKEQGLLTTAEVVAASQQGFVLAFDLPPLQQQAVIDVALQNHLQTQLQTLDLPDLGVYITKDQWQQFRSDYVAELKSGVTIPTIDLLQEPVVQAPEQSNTQADTDNVAQESVEEPIIAEAVAQFGDLVEIHDN